MCSCYTSALATIIKVAAVTVGSAFPSRHNRCFRSTAIRPSMVLLYWALFLPHRVTISVLIIGIITHASVNAVIRITES